MKIKRGPFSLFTDYKYWVVGLYRRDDNKPYRDIYLQKSEHYFNFGFGGPRVGDFVLTRQGHPWYYQNFQDDADRQRNRMRWVWGKRWSADWRTAAEIRRIEEENLRRQPHP